MSLSFWKRVRAFALSALLLPLAVSVSSCGPSGDEKGSEQPENSSEAPAAVFGISDDSSGADTSDVPADGSGDENRCLLQTLDGRFVIRVLAERCPDFGVSLRENVALAILEESAAAGFDPMLVLGLIQVESRFDPLARSSAGARGLVQLQAITTRHQASEEGIALTEEDVTMDPEWQVRLGIRYLAGLKKRFRQTELALIAYNAGPTKLQRLLNSSGRKKPALSPYQGYPRAVFRQQAIFEAERTSYLERMGSAAFQKDCEAGG